ncbi:hypothetical protein BHU09_11690 [Tannerella sp. oral taxon 808]|nr:hypothetical protein BHU09_11690 [Tannerella sp. oral taxon 808]
MGKLPVFFLGNELSFKVGSRLSSSQIRLQATNYKQKELKTDSIERSLPKTKLKFRLTNKYSKPKMLINRPNKALIMFRKVQTLLLSKLDLDFLEQRVNLKR